jgi:hypothetical protein
MAAPQPGSLVQAIEVATRTGPLGFEISQSTVTNDLGEYRLFELHSGKYLISAAPQSGTSRSNSFLNVRGTVVQGLPIGAGEPPPSPLFYPGTADSRSASEISVTSGALIVGVDMTIGRHRAFIFAEQLLATMSPFESFHCLPLLAQRHLFET